MRFVTGSELIRRSESELDALLHSFNEALARTRPYSEDWKDALLSVDNVLNERRRRAENPSPL